jgi:predicted DNA-binding transcriptional regulator AlpA
MEVSRLVLNSQEAADTLNLSVSTLAKLRLAGTGPAYHKLGRRVVYLPADLLAWLAKKRRNSTSEPSR